MVTDELKRAVQSESSAALVYWFGVGQETVWRWRLAFGIGQWDTPGSKRLHELTVEQAADKTRGQKLPEATIRKMRKAAQGRVERMRLEEARRWR
jgi:hypothetical protein